MVEVVIVVLILSMPDIWRAILNWYDEKHKDDR